MKNENVYHCFYVSYDIKFMLAIEFKIQIKQKNLIAHKIINYVKSRIKNQKKTQTKHEIQKLNKYKTLFNIVDRNINQKNKKKTKKNIT